AGNAGIALGPLATSLLLLFLDWHLVAVVLAVPAGLAVIFVLRIDFDENAAVSAEVDVETDGGRNGSVDSLGEFLSQSRTLLASSFILVFAVVMLSGLYYRGILTFLPDLLSDLPSFAPVEFAGTKLEPSRYLYSALLMVGMVGQYVGGRLTDSRLPVEYGIAIGYGTLGVIALV
ncbi:MAG: MFS transporter, partial [Halobacteria archaeon]|nr:MFS transporter [Halobacteria archaeon]